jgi:Fic-DOC domain mobile mystery protein B
VHFLLGGEEDGETPLDPDEVEELIPSWIATRGDLNRAEQEGVTRALASLNQRPPATAEILSEPFVRRLHLRMFRDVWKWAGRYRLTNKNIGVDSSHIAEEIGKLLGDAAYWVEHETFLRDEIAVRVHHRAVVIHPFVNGNGRHTRLLADLLAESLGGEPFSWGRNLGLEPRSLRAVYIAALRRADDGDLDDLLRFARA